MGSILKGTQWQILHESRLATQAIPNVSYYTMPRSSRSALGRTWTKNAHAGSVWL